MASENDPRDNPEKNELGSHADRRHPWALSPVLLGGRPCGADPRTCRAREQSGQVLARSGATGAERRFFTEGARPNRSAAAETGNKTDQDME